MIKLQELISVDSPISGKLRIHISKNPIEKLLSMTQCNFPHMQTIWNLVWIRT
jgi:hypothetical protein